MFGRRSEKTAHADQLESGLAKSEVEAEQADATLQASRTQQRRVKRRALPEHLPREEIVIEPEGRD